MAKCVKHLVVDPELKAGYIHDDSLPLPSEGTFEVRERWEPEPPTESWSDWALVDSIEDRDPTYYAEHHSDGNFLRTPSLRALHPHRRRTSIWERKLMRRWVDEENGPMMEVVDVERRSERP